MAHGKGAHSKLTASLTEAVFPEANKHSYHLANKQFKPHLPVLELEKSEPMFLYEQGLDARDRFEGSFRVSSVTNETIAASSWLECTAVSHCFPLCLGGQKHFEKLEKNFINTTAQKFGD